MRLWKVLLELDVPGLVLLSGGLIAILAPLGMQLNSTYGWASVQVLVPITAGLVALAVFVYYENRVAEFPVIPFRLLRIRTMACAAASAMLFFYTFNVTLFYFNAYLQTTRRISAHEAMMLQQGQSGYFVGLLVGGWAMQWSRRYRRWAWTGWCLVLLAVGLMIRTRNASATSNAEVAAVQVLFGIGGGLVVGSIGVGVQAAVDIADLPIAITLYGMVEYIGGVLGEGTATTVWVNMLPVKLKRRLNPDVDVHSTINNITYFNALPSDQQAIVQDAYTQTQMVLTICGMCAMALAAAAMLGLAPLSLAPETKDKQAADDADSLASGWNFVDMRLLGASVVALLGVLAGGVVEGRAPCDSQIYCQGELLHTVQMARLFDDNKEFVDRPTRKPAAQVLGAFAQLGPNATSDALAQFVEENFGPAGAELRKVAVEGLDTNPPLLERVHDPLLRAFGAEVNGYWGQLVRAQDMSVLCPGCESSMLELPHRFVVPGGRFREIYYWDTYFSLEGMLRSGLLTLAREAIQNLLTLVDKHGFVPNGARVYYLGRSQPPLLALMVKLYHEHSGDTEFVHSALPLLQREHKYWIDNHSVNVQCGPGNETLAMTRYITETDVPRPEAYSADYDLAHNVSATDADGQQQQIYEDVAAAAESGWDFSTRWVRNPEAPRDKVLQTIRTHAVVPVDLNAIMYQVETSIAELADLVHVPLPDDYRRMASRRRRAVDHLMLNPETGQYRDYILEDAKMSSVSSAGGLWPYWAFGGPSASAKKEFAAVSGLLEKNKGGIPATLRNSGQQWDWPMAWPPLQYVAIQAALQTGHQDLALRIAQAFVDSVFCGWYSTGGSLQGMLKQLPNKNDTGHIFEKYSSIEVGAPGGGGEYEVQPGFGWTNGVLLWALDLFGPQLCTPQCPGVTMLTTQHS
ncbi:hypothetical protein LPJ61_002165 [Coemansia biformis]|uniref:Trehalase n=1 Tax=Coemansia biformis TaxID=1286918 RepID=A0A9W7Y8T5_9FUNG|nr:hypothetical protein LPJ61_002165 [Coemansia biformis]